MIALLALVIACTARLCAGTGVGVQAGIIPPLFKVDLAESVAVTFKTAKIPCVFAVKLLFDDWHVMGGGITADMWLANPVIGSSVFHFFYGYGATLQGGDREARDRDVRHAVVFAAPRFVGGLNCLLTDSSELYMQAAVEPGVVFDERDGVTFRVLFPLEAGIRLWF